MSDFQQRDGFGQEEWRVIPSAPFYEVSSLGRVRRSVGGKSTRAGRILAATGRKKDGYGSVVLSLGGRDKAVHRLVHHLVAEAFLGLKPSGQHCVAHNDGDPRNNAAANLRWASHYENMQDATSTRHGSMAHGQRHPHARLTADQVKHLRTLRRGTGDIAAYARLCGVSISAASDAALGRTWKHLEMSK
jgi:hypothetical protein